MADLTINAALVIPDEGYGYTEGIAGEAVTQGQSAYLKAADSRWWRADADTLAEANAGGIVLTGVSAGQSVRIFTSGTITIGGTVVVGQIYVVSVNPGGIAPYSDLASGDFVTFLAIGISATKLQILRILASGIAKA